MPGTLLAFHYDMKRAMWADDFMAGYAATLAEWGYNTILYEVEDKLRFPKHPTLAHADALDAAETGVRMAALRARGFRVIPMVQSLGHAEAVLTKPGYERFRESPSHDTQYDPLSEDARGLILELIDNVIDAVHPEDYFHLGGDETWNLGQSEPCRPIVAEIGTGGLYLRHMLPIIAHVIARGLRPILWADIALSHPEIIERFPREVVWMDWDYWTVAGRNDSLHIWETARRFTWPELASVDAPGFTRDLAPYAIDEQTRRDGTFPAFPYTAALKGMGFDVITAPATRSWGDAMGIPFNSVHLPNCFIAARRGHDAGIGACVTSWAVRHSHPLVNLPGAYVAAQAFHGAEAFDADALLCRYAEARFGMALPAFADAVRLAEGRVPWCQSLEMTPPATASDAIRAWLDEVDAQPDGRAGLIAAIERTAAELAQAETLFHELRVRARTNARDFDYWLDGVAHTAFCAAFALAALRDRLPHEAGELKAQLDERRDATRALFAATFPPVSVEGELAVRYAFHEAVIDAAIISCHDPAGR